MRLPLEHGSAYTVDVFGDGVWENRVAHLLASYAASARLDYSLLELRDVANFPAASADVSKEANRDIAASNEVVVFIAAAQSVLRVRVELQIWDATPPFRKERGWQRTGAMRLTCPSGRLYLASPTSSPPFEIDDLPDGPGVYRLEVLYRGREGAMARIPEVNKETFELSCEEADPIFSKYADLEKYRIRMWWAQPLP